MSALPVDTVNPRKVAQEVVNILKSDHQEDLNKTRPLARTLNLYSPCNLFYLHDSLDEHLHSACSFIRASRPEHRAERARRSPHTAQAPPISPH